MPDADADADADGTDADVQAPAQGSEPEQLAALLGAGAGLPAPDAARQAETPEAALRAFEHLFFGEVKNVRDL